MMPPKTIPKFRYYLFEVGSGTFWGTDDLDHVYRYVSEHDENWRGIDAVSGEELWDIERDKEGRASISLIGG